jgi:hypothetical protein
VGGAIRHRRGPANAGPLYFVYFCSIRSGYAQIKHPIIFAYCSIGLGAASDTESCAGRTLCTNNAGNVRKTCDFVQKTIKKAWVSCKNRALFQSKNGRFQPATTSGRTGAAPVSSSPCCLHKIRPHGRKTAPQAPTKGITGPNG